jgi:hypothetical protein
MRKLQLCRLPVLLFALLLGCNSQIPGLRDWADEGIGQPITNLEAIDMRPESYAGRIGWRKTTYDLPNANRVYVHPDRKDCEVRYEADKAGIAVGYQLVGKGCRYQ